MKYRIQGREKLLTLGTYPQLSLKEAREAAADAKKRLSGGIDPSMGKKVKARSAQTTFEFFSRGNGTKTKNPPGRKGYAKDVMERIDKNVFLLLGNRPVGDITSPEQLAVLQKIETRGAVDQAHRVRSICALIFRYAFATGRAERDHRRRLARCSQNLRPHFPRRHHRAESHRRAAAGH